MQIACLVPLAVFLSALASGQSTDTGTAHRTAATALLNSNNTGAAHLACPAAILPEPTSNPPGGGPARGADTPGVGRAGGRGAGGRGVTPPRENWYAEGGQVFDNLYMLTTKVNSAWALSGNTSKEMLQSYISNASRLLDLADGAGADVIIGNHTEYKDALARLEQTKARKPGDANPWVIGKPEVRKYLTVVQECAKSWLAIGEGRP